jgi:multisubunit Na+/H+ antiporter MnhE subunit
MDFFRTRRRRRAWLHTQRSFSVAHWVVGFPAALWIVYRLSYYAPALTRLHPALLGAIYAYVFLLSLLVFRGIVWLVRWLFPVVEFAGSRSKVVRSVLSLVLSSLLLALLYDVLKMIFWRM